MSEMELVELYGVIASNNPTLVMHNSGTLINNRYIYDIIIHEITIKSVLYI